MAREFGCQQNALAALNLTKFSEKLQNDLGVVREARALTAD